MKTTLTVLAMIACFLIVSGNAFAGEWYAALEKEIIETGNISHAVENAQKAGAENEELLIAVSSIIENYKLGLGDPNCGVCQVLQCADASTTGSTYCTPDLREWCITNCPDHGPS